MIKAHILFLNDLKKDASYSLYLGKNLVSTLSFPEERYLFLVLLEGEYELKVKGPSFFRKNRKLKLNDNNRYLFVSSLGIYPTEKQVFEQTLKEEEPFVREQEKEVSSCLVEKIKKINFCGCRHICGKDKVSKRYVFRFQMDSGRSFFVTLNGDDASVVETILNYTYGDESVALNGAHYFLSPEYVNSEYHDVTKVLSMVSQKKVSGEEKLRLFKDYPDYLFYEEMEKN